MFRNNSNFQISKTFDPFHNNDTFYFDTFQDYATNTVKYWRTMHRNNPAKFTSSKSTIETLEKGMKYVHN